jgi:hypothetical protein
MKNCKKRYYYRPLTESELLGEKILIEAISVVLIGGILHAVFKK